MPTGQEVLDKGFRDVATPFHNPTNEEEHLEIVDSLRSNISYAYYPFGHMIVHTCVPCRRCMTTWPGSSRKTAIKGAEDGVQGTPS